MPYSSRSSVNRLRPSNRFPVGLKWLLISNIAIFVLTFLLQNTEITSLLRYFRLVPSDVVQSFAIWQMVTYLFLHAGIGHILWNMLALWMFGAEMERLWGTERFLQYYFACGVGTAVCIILCAYAVGAPQIGTVGSSGAIYGLLLAYAISFPDRMILFSFLIPMKSKYFVMIIGAIVFLQSFQGFRSGVSDVAHLGGLLVGFLILRGRWLRLKLQQPAQGAMKEWKLRRARRKFEVYLRKQDSKRGPRVH